MRRLVEGHDALIPRRVYEEHRSTTHRVLARVSPVRSTAPWASLAVTVENIVQPRCEKLSDDPPSLSFDPSCEEWLNRYLAAAPSFERLLLPLRLLRALNHMSSYQTLGNRKPRNSRLRNQRALE